MPHRGDEAVQGLPPLCVLDCDWAEVVSEPDGRDDPARVTVGNVLLHQERKKSVRELVVLLEAFPRIDTVTTDSTPVAFLLRLQFKINMATKNWQWKHLN